MTMKKYSLIHIPALSFFSKDLYRDVGLHWKGVNFLYLLLLLVICWTPTLIKVHVGFTSFVKNIAPAVVEQLPEITFDNGEASISEPQPYYIINPDDGAVLAIIDTTGQINSLEGTDAICLLTRDKVIARKSKFENRTFDLSQMKEHFVLNSELVMGWLRTANKFLAIAIAPFAILGSYSFRIVQALLYAVAGLMFAAGCKAKLSYAALIRLAVVAMTPCLLAKTIFGLAGIHLPFASLIFLAITLGYLFFAIKANSVAIVIQEESEGPEEIMI